MPDTATKTGTLPAQFADLEKFSAWCLATEPERYGKRLESTMSDMQEFYDAGMARIDEAMNYLDQFPLKAMPEDARNLMHMMQSLVMVSFPIECWKQPRVPDSGAAWVTIIKEPVV